MKIIRHENLKLLVYNCLHTVGTHAPAAFSDVATNTTTIPCTVDVHTPTVLSGYLSPASSFKFNLDLAAYQAAREIKGQSVRSQHMGYGM